MYTIISGQHRGMISFASLHKIMNLIQKIQSFFKEVYVEMRKVNWLTRTELLRYTLLVLAVTIVVAAILGGLDYLFSTLVKNFIIKQ